MVWIIKESLEKCPFCGGEAELKLSQHGIREEICCVRAVCKECGASTPQAMTGKTMFGGYVSLDEAIVKAKDRWNKRKVSQVVEVVTV